MKTKPVKIIIERSKDAYWAYAENMEGVNGVGKTVLEAKQSVLEGLELAQELGNIPVANYSLVFKYDTESLMQYYKGIFSAPAFERLTGINQKQILQYGSGLKKPRPAQTKKIEAALHNLGRELLAVEL